VRRETERRKEALRIVGGLDQLLDKLLDTPHRIVGVMNPLVMLEHKNLDMGLVHAKVCCWFNWIDWLVLFLQHA
jgi:hypothetical protein